MRKHPGTFVARPGSLEEQSYRRIVAIVRVIIRPGFWSYDATLRKNVWTEPLFFSYIDYGITSAWFPD